MIRGGRNTITSVPAFSNDAKNRLLCSANSVSVCNVDTGLRITSLEGHTAPVTTVIVVPLPGITTSLCWTTSLDGKIRLWDFSEPEILKTVDVQFPVYSMVIPSHMSDDVIAYASVEDCSNVSKDLFGQIKRLNIFEEPFHSCDTLKEMEEPKPIVTSLSGEFFGVCHECKIHIWNASCGKMAKEMATLHHTQLITVFVFHPNKKMLAAGDVTGRVLIWKEFGNGEVTSVKSEEDDDDSCTVFNWHSDEVTVLNFSLDGAFLFSGGKEGVLVVWELDTGKKQLMPKIESPLLYVIFSSDPTLSSVICADNHIHFLKMPSMEISRTISGIKPPTSMPTGFICYIKKMNISLIRTVSIDHSSGIAAFSTANHHVQLYNLLSDCEISKVQICDDEVQVQVSAIALSRNGSVMTTAEVRLAAGSLSEGLVSLKFWVFVPDNTTFSLSTVINQPHREAAITAITISPVHSMAVTISSAGDFKIWVCESDKNLTVEDKWICHGVGSYKKKPITAAAISGDGSGLALAATTIITLWDQKKNELMFAFEKSHESITHLSFACGYIVAAHCYASLLSVWDMMTLRLSWSYRLKIEAIATQASLFDPYFAVLTWLPESCSSVKSNDQIFRGKDGAILLFDGSGPKPVAIWTVMNARGGSLSFVEDNKKSQILLAYVNMNHEYVLFDPYSDETLETSAKDYEVLLAAITKKKKRSRKKTLLAMSERPLEKRFCGSTLNIPPFPGVCASFFASRMRKRICERVEMQPESHSP